MTAMDRICADLHRQEASRSVRGKLSYRIRGVKPLAALQ
jgi:hypothetical protein